MLNDQFSIAFFIRKGKKRKDGRCPIYMKISVDGGSTELSTQQRIRPSHWDSDKTRASSSCSNRNEINEHLNNLENKALQARNVLYRSDELVTPHSIKEYIKDDGLAPSYLIKEFEKHNKKVKELIGVEYAAATYQKYKRCKKYMQEYIQDMFQRSDYLIDHIDKEWLEDLRGWLKKK